MAIALRAMAALRQSAHRSPVGDPLSSNINSDMQDIGQPVARDAARDGSYGIT